MQDRPNMGELVSAVREFLESEIAPLLSDPRLKFRTLVAMNALGMVARESELEEGRLRDEAASLFTLLGISESGPNDFSALKSRLLEANASLAQSIRSGQIPPGCIEHLQRVTRAKLEVSNPGYLKKY
jgi:Domain of unknown function (DUF6285)